MICWQFSLSVRTSSCVSGANELVNPSDQVEVTCVCVFVCARAGSVCARAGSVCVGACWCECGSVCVLGYFGLTLPSTCNDMQLSCIFKKKKLLVVVVVGEYSNWDEDSHINGSCCIVSKFLMTTDYDKRFFMFLSLSIETKT